MLTFDLFTIVLQLSLLAAANAASQAKGKGAKITIFIFNNLDTFLIDLGLS